MEAPILIQTSLARTCRHVGLACGGLHEHCYHDRVPCYDDFTMIFQAHRRLGVGASCLGLGATLIPESRNSGLPGFRSEGFRV